MAKLGHIFEEILRVEGWPKVSDHPADRGGLTKGPITQATLSSWRGHKTRRLELKELTKAESIAILKRQYLESNGIQKLQDHPILHQVVDDAVLSSPYLAVKDLQRALDDPEVDIDGLIGPITLQAVEAADDTLGARLAVVRSLRLAKFAIAQQSQLVFLYGWLRRSLSFAHGSNQT